MIKPFKFKTGKVPIGLIKTKSAFDIGTKAMKNVLNEKGNLSLKEVNK